MLQLAQVVTLSAQLALSGAAAVSQSTNIVEASVDAIGKELRSVLSSEQVRENLENSRCWQWRRSRACWPPPAEERGFNPSPIRAAF